VTQLTGGAKKLRCNKTEEVNLFSETMKETSYILNEQKRTSCLEADAVKQYSTHGLSNRYYV
jgi:hypothetical protein